MMTFRVSEVESFRQWKHDEAAELDMLLARLRGETPASEAMLAGTAFHKALELAAPKEHTALHALGYTFRIVGDFDLAIPTIREIRASKTYDTPIGPITVSGQLDALHGKRIEDHKTTGNFDRAYERYLSGFQWRYYLDIFEADHFRWNVFEICATDDELTWDVFDFHTLEQYRYPSLHNDCHALACELAAFAVEHLPERIKREALAA